MLCNLIPWKVVFILFVFYVRVHCTHPNCLSFLTLLQYNPLVEDGRDIEVLDRDNKVSWSATMAIWPCKGRDFVTHIRRARLDDGSVAIVNSATTHHEVSQQTYFTCLPICLCVCCGLILLALRCVRLMLRCHASLCHALCCGEQ